MSAVQVANGSISHLHTAEAHAKLTCLNMCTNTQRERERGRGRERQTERKREREGGMVVPRGQMAERLGNRAINQKVSGSIQLMTLSFGL